MKQFLKMTLATICGVVILGLVMTLFFLISLVGMVASDSAPTKVKENSVFVRKLNRTIDERSAT
jgi:protease-4